MDGIPNEFLKAATGFIFAWLNVFNNYAFSHSCLPSSLTVVVVVPILKSSLKDQVDANNYRPIAIPRELPKLSKKII